MKRSMDNVCEICKRTFHSSEGRFPVGRPTKHHVIPKQKYRDKWQDADVILVCRSCHRQIHRFFSNNDLKHMSVEELKTHPKVKHWIQWITHR